MSAETLEELEANAARGYRTKTASGTEERLVLTEGTRKVLAGVEDLMFRSKISETAETLGAEATFPRGPGKLLEAARSSPPDLLILDLASERFEPLDLLREISSDESLADIQTVGFLPHVEKDLARAAREAGCKKIMARSAFTKDLPEIVSGEKSQKGQKA